MAPNSLIGLLAETIQKCSRKIGERRTARRLNGELIKIQGSFSEGAAEFNFCIQTAQKNR